MTSTTAHPWLATFDLRCSACLSEPGGGAGRCQLFLGHDSPHAIVYSDSAGRHVRTWNCGEVSAEDDCTELSRLPWMYGYPVPAWIVSP